MLQIPTMRVSAGVPCSLMTDQQAGLQPFAQCFDIFQHEGPAASLFDGRQLRVLGQHRTKEAFGQARFLPQGRHN